MISQSLSIDIATCSYYYDLCRIGYSLGASIVWRFSVKNKFRHKTFERKNPWSLKNRYLWRDNSFGHHLRKRSTITALPLFLVILESIDCFFDLCPQISAMERFLVNHLFTLLAVPPEPVHAVCRARLFQDDADGVCETDGVMRCVRWKKEHLAFMDRYIAERSFVDHFEHHGALVLVEPFSSLVYVVIRPSIRTTDDLKNG